MNRTVNAAHSALVLALACGARDARLVRLDLYRIA